MELAQREINQLLENRSPGELKNLLAELIKRMLPPGGQRKSVRVVDANNNPVGILLTAEGIANPDLSDRDTMLAITKYRLEHPPKRYLTSEELLNALLDPSLASAIIAENADRYDSDRSMPGKP